jgi:hypothetical protein
MGKDINLFRKCELLIIKDEVIAQYECVATANIIVCLAVYMQLSSLLLFYCTYIHTLMLWPYWPSSGIVRNENKKRR